jgi:hypothetical protein
MPIFFILNIPSPPLLRGCTSLPPQRGDGDPPLEPLACRTSDTIPRCRARRDGARRSLHTWGRRNSPEDPYRILLVGSSDILSRWGPQFSGSPVSSFSPPHPMAWSRGHPAGGATLGLSKKRARTMPGRFFARKSRPALAVPENNANNGGLLKTAPGSPLKTGPHPLDLFFSPKAELQNASFFGPTHERNAQYRQNSIEPRVLRWRRNNRHLRLFCFAASRDAGPGRWVVHVGDDRGRRSFGFPHR